MSFSTARWDPFQEPGACEERGDPEGRVGHRFVGLFRRLRTRAQRGFLRVLVVHAQAGRLAGVIAGLQSHRGGIATRRESATRGAMRDVGNARAAAVTRVRRTPAVRGTAIAAPRATVIVVMTASIVSTDSIDADKDSDWRISIAKNEGEER